MRDEGKTINCSVSPNNGVPGVVSLTLCGRSGARISSQNRELRRTLTCLSPSIRPLQSVIAGWRDHNTRRQYRRWRPHSFRGVKSRIEEIHGKAQRSSRNTSCQRRLGNWGLERVKKSTLGIFEVIQNLSRHHKRRLGAF